MKSASIQPQLRRYTDPQTAERGEDGSAVEIHAARSAAPSPTGKTGPRRIVNVIGGGIMGLMAAIELARLAGRFRLGLAIRVFESGAFGGGPHDRTASYRCQLWRHTQGTLYALAQPSISLALQQSTARLRTLVPSAFRHPLAVAVDRPGRVPRASECFRVLGIAHRRVPEDVLRAWTPEVRVPQGSDLYRVRDGVIDLRMLAAGLAIHARRLGVELVYQRIGRIEAGRGQVRHLLSATDESFRVGRDDLVVLTCGANIRPLLATAGVTVPGLRLFKSHLVATNALGIRTLLIVLQGGNCIPHEMADGRVANLFGNTGRTEVYPDQDHAPLEHDVAAAAQVIADVREQLGLTVPPDALSWPAVKTEIVHEGMYSQLHHAFRLAELANTFVALPGKLSQSAACADDLARKIVRELVEGELARPVWEQGEHRALLEKAA